MKHLNIKLGKDFMPAPQLKSLLYTYFFAVIILIIVPIGALIAFFVPILAIIIGIPVLVLLILVGVWISLFYNTIIYRINSSEIVWRRGVWFKNTGIVPFNRITNIDIIQGPVSRYFGIASLKVQTAGYSGPNQRSSEIRLDGIERFEDLREFIMKFVRGKKPVAVEAYDDSEVSGKTDVVKELVKIRKLLEKKR